MAEYLAQRIIDGALEYCAVIKKKPELKTDIDKFLTEKKHAELIRTDCPVV